VTIKPGSLTDVITEESIVRCTLEETARLPRLAKEIIISIVKRNI